MSSENCPPPSERWSPEKPFIGKIDTLEIVSLKILLREPKFLRGPVFSGPFLLEPLFLWPFSPNLNCSCSSDKDDDNKI